MTPYNAKGAQCRFHSINSPMLATSTVELTLPLIRKRRRQLIILVQLYSLLDVFAGTELNSEIGEE
jgi:hypothetical protein